MTGEHIVIVALVLLNVVQFSALVFFMVRTAPMLPEGVVRELLTHVSNTGMVVAEEGLARVEAVAELTETQLDDIAVTIGKSVLAGLRRDMNANDMVIAQTAPPVSNKKGVVVTPLEEK